MKNPLLTLGVLALAACGGGDAPEPAPETSTPAAAAAPARSVTILEPANGATVAGPSVVVRLTTENLPIVPAGDMTPGTGHHHLYLDADLGDMMAPVPTVPGSIVHMGTGVSEYTFENVPSGQHRLIAVVADGVHISLNPPVTDTVVFTVR